MATWKCEAIINVIILPCRPRAKFIKYLDSWYDGKLPLSTEPYYENWESELEKHFKAETFYGQLVVEAKENWNKKSTKEKTKVSYAEFERRYVSGKGANRIIKRLNEYCSDFPFFADQRHILMERIKVKTMAVCIIIYESTQTRTNKNICIS